MKTTRSPKRPEKKKFIYGYLQIVFVQNVMDPDWWIILVEKPFPLQSRPSGLEAWLVILSVLFLGILFEMDFTHHVDLAC